MYKQILKTIKNNLNLKNQPSLVELNRIDALTQDETNPKCGVYCLIKYDTRMKTSEIVYAGFSNNLLSRLKTHCQFASNSKKFNRCVYIEIDNEKRAREVETCLIIKFKPEYNHPSTWENPLKLNNAMKMYTDYIYEVKKSLLENNNDNKKHFKHSTITYSDWYKHQMARLNGEPHKLILF